MIYVEWCLLSLESGLAMLGRWSIRYGQYVIKSSRGRQNQWP